MFYRICLHTLEKARQSFLPFPGPALSSYPLRLTAFVLKSFAQSRGFIYIDPEELRSAKSWLTAHQRPEGSFPAMGRILNKDLQVCVASVCVWRGVHCVCV